MFHVEQWLTSLNSVEFPDSKPPFHLPQNLPQITVVFHRRGLFTQSNQNPACPPASPSPSAGS
jgi:hypothetical protein